MSILHKMGFMTIKEHNSSVQRNVDEINRYMATELEKRNMLVDETLQEMVKWKYDSGELMKPSNAPGERMGVSIMLEVPKSLLIGMVRAEPEVSGFALSRVTYLLKAGIQRAVNQILAPYGGGDSPAGSYL